MATTLLAMFIALSTLAKDQTGINLYNGTGSFLQVQQSFGLPGLFGHSSRAIQLEQPGPHYQQGTSSGQGGTGPRGAGGADGAARAIDAEQEQFQRFLRELERPFRVEKLPRVTGQAVVDFYDPLNRSAPHLGARHLEVIAQVAPLLGRPDYRVHLVVWAATPRETAWVRAVDEAQRLAEEVAATLGLAADARARLIPMGQAWRFANVRRPALSLVITRTEPHR